MNLRTNFELALVLTRMKGETKPEEIELLSRLLDNGIIPEEYQYLYKTLENRGDPSRL